MAVAPELEQCIAACESFIQWSEPPRPEGMSPDAQRAAINRAWAIVKGAARDNLSKAQTEPRPDPTVPERRRPTKRAWK